MSQPNTQFILAAITPIVEALEELGVDYYIGGSVASSVHGILRGTFDADLITNLRVEHVKRLVKRLETDYYIDEDAVKDAIRRRSSFNAVHYGTMLKVDIFILKPRAFNQEESLRAQPQLLMEGTRPFYVASSEDTVLTKLEWYRMGGEISDRQ